MYQDNEYVLRVKRIIVHKIIRSFRIVARGIIFILFTLIGTGILIGLFAFAAEYFYSINMGTLGAIFTIGIFAVFLVACIYLIVRGVRWIILLFSQKEA